MAEGKAAKGITSLAALTLNTEAIRFVWRSSSPTTSLLSPLQRTNCFKRGTPVTDVSFQPGRKKVVPREYFCLAYWERMTSKSFFPSLRFNLKTMKKWEIDGRLSLFSAGFFVSEESCNNKDNEVIFFIFPFLPKKIAKMLQRLNSTWKNPCKQFVS